MQRSQHEHDARLAAKAATKLADLATHSQLTDPAVLDRKRAVIDAALARARGRADIERIPVKPPKKAKPHRHGVAWWIEQDGRLWLVRRPGKGMLGGMRALPGGEWADTPADESGIASVDHGFTHFDLTLTLIRRPAPPEGSPEARDAAAEGEWWPISDLDAAGLPTLYRKLVDKMRERDA